MNYTKFNEEVYYTQDTITKVTSDVIDFLKREASNNKRRRVRLCTHKDINDPVHEMLIVHAKNNYVPPHKHLYKSESFHIIEGRLQVIIFHDDGSIREVIQMGDVSSGEILYYRLSEGYFHTVIPLTEWIVFHETTKGPFNPEETIYPIWAPDDNDPVNYARYRKKLSKDLLLLGTSTANKNQVQ